MISDTERILLKPGTYKEIPKHISPGGIIIDVEEDGKASPVSLIEFLTSIPRGMEEASDIIFFIFIVGGVFGILHKTGTIIAFIQKLLTAFGNSARAMVIVLMISLGTGASTLGMGEEFIPLIPLFLIISKELGYDRIFGLAIVVISAEVGFAAATTNPFTVQIAQGIAGISPGSGTGFRIIFFLVCISTAIFFLLRYGAKIRKDPSLSVMKDDDLTTEDLSFDKIEFRKSHVFIIIISILLFALLIFTVQFFGWWINEMAGGFILIGIISVLIARLPFNEAAKAFVKGMEDMVVAAMVVGFARGVQVVLSDGMILDTIIFSAAASLENFHEFVAAGGMLVFQTGLNFFIPSGSGQAAVTMPIMAPLSDLLGLTRQTAVFAFTCGDGFSNMIIPTSGLLMAYLGVAKVSYTTWFRFILPLFLILFFLSMIFLAIAVVIGY
ncbi:MAG: putative basic amino acid antiporter YfcC [Ignavibacteriaceae bacterium]